MMQGKMVIVSAPSGAGKTTIVRHIIGSIPSLGFSVSATSRKPRDCEVDGQDYYFLTSEDFRKKIEADEFFEWEQVYQGMYYGTLNSEIERIWKLGKNIIFDVDVKGGLNLKKLSGDSAISLFIMPPSVGALEKRLRLRAKDSEETIRIRVEKATKELEFSGYFDIIIVNDDLTKAKKEALDSVLRFLNSEGI